MKTSVNLAAYDAVILDFDGPMCNVFAGYPAATIASELKQRLVEGGWPAESLPATSDPHQILRLVAEQRPDLASTVETALAAAEAIAVETAIETPGLAPLLAQLRKWGVPVAIASNNHAGAIRRWLAQRGYSIDHVVGRDPASPATMKPAPDVVIAALALLSVDAHRAIFVGDAASDAAAANGAGCPFVAYANKRHKLELFADLRCLAIITDLNQLSVNVGVMASQE